jgi:hypothetical protein
LQAVEHLTQFFFTANLALQLIEHESLKASFQCLGVELPCHKKLSGPILNERYIEVIALHCRGVGSSAAEADQQQRRQLSSRAGPTAYRSSYSVA